MKQKYAPIAFFCYKRPEKTRAALESLARNTEATQSDLIVFVDGPKNSREAESQNRVIEVVRSVSGFKSIELTVSPQNRGLSKSLTSGIAQVLQEHDAAVIVEDDLVVSPFFLRYINDGLRRYADSESVASIHGYTYPTKVSLPETFFLRGADCWGWGTWNRAWLHFRDDASLLLTKLQESPHRKDFDFDNSFGFSRMLQDRANFRNDSWAVLWYASAFTANMFTLYPGRPLVQNTGHDESGTHSGMSDAFRVALSRVPVVVEEIELVDSEVGRNAFRDFFLSESRESYKRKMIRRFHKTRSLF